MDLPEPTCPEPEAEPRSVVVATRRSRATARNAVVWSTLRDALAVQLQPDPAHPGDQVLLDILDAGGGTGGFAVPLAELGHRVTVVDPSPDSLAALERRAAEAGIQTIRGVQGDAAGLQEVAGPESYDVVLCHHVLEVVDDPAVAIAAMVRVLRHGGLLSVLVSNVNGAVLSRAVAGRLDEAVELLEDSTGHAGPNDPLVRRYDRPRLLAQLAQAGLEVEALHGSRVFGDLLPGTLLEIDPAAAEALRRLEELVAGRPEFTDVAAALHALGRRPGPAAG
ncbi:methyltransferase [Acidothermaceae bacterium B102]|nr:methyltransferase [Acidothermaceae bacterium B102]